MEKYDLDFGSIKNVGIAAVDSIVKERKQKGEFQSFTDFCERMQGEAVNKKCIESLIKAGAFDGFEETRATLMASFETIIDTIQDTNRKSFAGQVTMFDLEGEQEENLDNLKYHFQEKQEYSEKELLGMEKEMLGLYISGHPLENIRQQIENQTNISTLKMRQIQESEQEEELQGKSEYSDGQFIKYAGIITSVKKKYTKNNKIMAFVTIEDLYGSAEVIVFENCYQTSSNSLVEDNIVLVEGRLSIREDEEVKIVAREISDFGVKRKKVLEVNITNMEKPQKENLRGMIKFFSGDKNNVPIQVIEKEEIKPCGAIYLTNDILEEFEETLGKENVELKEI